MSVPSSSQAQDFTLLSRAFRLNNGNGLPILKWHGKQKIYLQLRGGDNDDPYDSREDDDPFDYYNPDKQGGYHDDGQYNPGDRYDRVDGISRILKKGDKRIGISLLGAGVVFTMFGVALFFNKSLMRLGNLLFIAGVPMTIGPGRTAGYFLQPKKSRATACLAIGILIVFLGSPVIGILLEIFGFLNLFGNLFPLVKMMVKNLPGIGIVFRKDNTYSWGRNRDSYSAKRNSVREIHEEKYSGDYRNDERVDKYYQNDNNDGEDSHPYY